MPIRMQKPSEGGNFSVAIEERFDVSEDYVVELMSMDEYNGISKIDGKPFTSIIWHCRIFDADGIAFTNEIDHAPYDFAEFSSMSLVKGKKGPAKAREWAGVFLGHELSEEECETLAENFDGALVGKRALASFKLEDDGAGGKKMRFALLRPVRKPRSAASTPVNGTAPVQAPPPQPAPPVSQPGRETAAQRRARLEAELAAMEDDDEGDDDEPFN